MHGLRVRYRSTAHECGGACPLFKCFGCDAGGDAFSLVQLKEGLDFPAALEFLARRAGIELQRDDEAPRAQAQRRRRARELVPLDRAAAFYAQHLRSPRSPAAVRADEYLASRGIHDAIRDQFKIGFAPTDDAALVSAARAAGFATKEMRDVGLVTRPRGGGPLQDRFRGRLMFPVCDIHGRVLGFGARKLGNDERGPKYVNSPAGAIYSKGELLFGAHHARAAAAKAGAVIVVEGYLDALAMHQAGICNTVALMGTAATEHQIAALKRLAPAVVLMLDGDEAGRQAIIRAGAVAQRAGMTTLVASLPDGSDPAALVQRHGADAARELVGRAHSFARAQVQAVLGCADTTTAEGKDGAVAELHDVFANVPPGAVREELLELVAQHLAFDPGRVGTWLGAPREAGPTGSARGQSQPATSRCHSASSRWEQRAGRSRP
jgi:DNA primase